MKMITAKCVNLILSPRFNSEMSKQPQMWPAFWNLCSTKHYWAQDWYCGKHDWSAHRKTSWRPLFGHLTWFAWPGCTRANSLWNSGNCQGRCSQINWSKIRERESWNQINSHTGEFWLFPCDWHLMGRLSGFKYRQICKKLRSLGVEFDRQAAGSHEIWYRKQSGLFTTIPNHPGDMPEGTLRAILKQLEISPEEFLDS